jgi:hypothetical protein
LCRAPSSFKNAVALSDAIPWEIAVLAKPSDKFSALVDSLLAEGLSVRFRAGGRSMLPTLRDGDCVTVAPVDPRAVAIGDVVLCRTSGGPIVHRVAQRSGGAGEARFTLRGDASFENDRPVGAPDLLGRVVGVDRAPEAPLIRVGRRLRSFLYAVVRACLALGWASSP